MTTIGYKKVTDAIDTLVENWGIEVADRVIRAIWNQNRRNMKFDDFLNECNCCGGNWGGMLLSGIKRLYPEVYEAIPEDMGCFAWTCICSCLILLGIYTKEET